MLGTTLDWMSLKGLVALTSSMERHQKLMGIPQPYDAMLDAKTATDWDMANFFYVEATRKGWPAHILYLESNPGACITMCLIRDKAGRWTWMAWGIQRSLDTIPPGVLLSKLYGPFATLRDGVDACKRYYQGRFGRRATFTGISPQDVWNGFITPGMTIEDFIAVCHTWPHAPRKKLVA